MFRYKWHVLVMLLLSMVGFSMVNAYTINVENRDPFGTLNLSTLMIKPNANSDSTIELSGNTLQIKTSEGNTGTIRVGLVCNENGTSCKDVQTLLKYADIEWGQVPIGLGNPEHVLFPKNTGSNIWVGKLSNLEREEESEYKLRVVGKTQLEGDLLVSGGKIKVHQICDENGENCRDVSQLYTGNGVGGGGDTYWNIHTYEPEDGDATVLFPIWSYNVWIGINGMPTVANNYKLRVNGKTKLEGDLLVTGGNITVYQICDETGKCKKVSELYTGNGVGGGGGDVYWQLNEGILSTSGGNYGVNLNNNLSVASSLNAGSLSTRGLNVTGNFNFAWENDEHGYNTVSTTKASLHVGSSLLVAHDFTSNGTITAKGNITVSGGQVRVNEICDKGGENCRTVSQITTGNNYWKIKNNTRNLTMSVDNYGLSLSTQYQAGTPQEYSFAIMDGSITKGKLKIGNVGVDLRGNTTLNNALTVKGNANLQSGLTVTGGTTLNNDLTVEGNTTLNNALTVEGDANLNSGLHVNGDLYVESIMGTPTVQQTKTLLSLLTGSMTIDVNTTVKQELDVEKNLNVSGNTNLHNLHVDATTNLSGALNVSQRAQFDNGVSINSGALSVSKDAIFNGNTYMYSSSYVNKIYIGKNTGYYDTNCYSENCVANNIDDISAVRFIPKTLYSGQNIETMYPCSNQNEGTFVYRRDRNKDHDYYDFEGRLSICGCGKRSGVVSGSCSWYTIHEWNY